MPRTHLVAGGHAQRDRKQIVLEVVAFAQALTSNVALTRPFESQTHTSTNQPQSITLAALRLFAVAAQPSLLAAHSIRHVHITLVYEQTRMIPPVMHQQ
jgi:hypothetical protein